jgi:uncharacterized protein
VTTYSIKRTIVGTLERDADLYDGITRIIREHNVTVGRITAIGSVRRAKLAYYDQKQMQYTTVEVPQPMEIVSLYGNISVKDGLPFAHVHVVLSDELGNGKGGHLLSGGTPVFACELTVEEYNGPPLTRVTDPATGLSLWSGENSL